MDSVTSRSTPELLPTRTTRMIPVGAGQGIHLIATCLLNAPTSRMSIAEIYEWLAEKYPEKQYTKYKIRKVLKHDSERKSPRFVIANKYRIAGAPLRWTIRPGTEPQLRQCFGGPPPESLIPQFYGGLSQAIHCVLCNRGFDRYETFVKHQQEGHSNDATMSPAVHQEMRSVVHASAAIDKSRTGSIRAASKAHPPDELTDPRPAAESEAEMEFAMRGEDELTDPGPTAESRAEMEFATRGEIPMGDGVMEEETLFVDEVPTAAEGGERRRDEECELDKWASADESAAGDETLIDAQFFEDAASHQSSDDGLYSVNYKMAEKQEAGRTYYLIHGTVIAIL